MLTGASGFLGSMLKQKLKSSYHILSMGRDPESDIVVDLQNCPPTITMALDFVIHAAGLAHEYPRSQEEQNKFIEVNYVGTKNLLSALENDLIKPKALVFISSVAVYGLDDGEQISEESPLNGVTPYARSKILAEQFVEKWGESNGVTISILRLPLVCGPNPPGNLGQLIESLRSGLYAGIGEGHNRKSMVFGPDVAKVMPALFEKGGIYHLTDGYHPTFRELEDAIAQSLGTRISIRLPISLVKLLAKLGDTLGSIFPINSAKLSKITSTLTFNDDRARKELDFKSTRVLDVMDIITV